MGSPGSGAHDRNTGGHDRQGNARGDRTGGGMSHAEQSRIVSPQGYGAPALGGPTIGRGQAPHSPRPGTQDRWGYYSNGQEDPAQAQDHQLYNAAANNLQSRGFGGWVKDHLLDMVPGFHQVTPDPNLPGTYKGGIYHDAWNPVSAVVGLASPYGSGLVTSKIAQAATDALHTPEFTFGGAGWGPTTSPTPTAPGAPSPTNQMASAGQPHPGTFGSTGSSNPMAAFGASPASSTPGGAAFGVQPQSPMAAFPTAPKIPNHSLPQGYQSMFPGSLTDQDKALLYAKALA